MKKLLLLLTKTITKRVVKSPAQTRSVEIPAEYGTVAKKSIKNSCSKQELFEVPAEFTTVTKRRLVKEGGFTEWREVVCNQKSYC